MLPDSVKRVTLLTCKEATYGQDGYLRGARKKSQQPRSLVGWVHSRVHSRRQESVTTGPEVPGVPRPESDVHARLAGLSFVSSVRPTWWGRRETAKMLAS